MSRAILIDVENRTISEVDVVRDEQGSQLQSIYGHLKCSTFEVVGYDYENDVCRRRHSITYGGNK